MNSDQVSAMFGIGTILLLGSALALALVRALWEKFGKETQKPPSPGSIVDVLLGIGKVGIWIGVGLIAMSCYFFADEDGYLPHTRKIQVVYPKHGWEVGEYVTCGTLAPGTNAFYLDCGDDGTLREMDVTIWARVEKNALLFKCQRGSDSISCHLIPREKGK